MTPCLPVSDFGVLELHVRGNRWTHQCHEWDCREKASFKALSWWWRSAARLVEVGGGDCRHLKRSRDSWGVGRKVACDASLGSSMPDTSWMGSWFSSLKRLMRAGEPSEYLIDTYKKFHRLCLHEVLLKVHIKPQGPLGTLNPGK